MIQITHIEEEGYKTFFICSNKSEHEVKEFLKRLKGNFYRYNTAKLGIHYQKTMSSYPLKSFERGLNSIIEENKGKIIVYKNYDEWEKDRLSFIKARETSNIGEINKAVKNFLETKYMPIHIQKEYTHTNLNVRADFFAVTKDRKTISIEVKSDKDSIARLEKQLSGYRDFSHIVYVATDIKNYSKVEKLIDSSGSIWFSGILLYENKKLTEVSKPYIFEEIKAEKVLWKQEYIKMLYGLNVKNTNKMSIDNLREIAETIFSVKEYRKLCEYLFTERYIQDNDMDYIQKLYNHKECKKEIIREIEKQQKGKI